jgi:hypothetical protein
VSGQLHAPAALPPGKSSRYPLYRRLGGPQTESRIFSLLHVVQTDSGAQPASYTIGTGGGFFSPEVKWQGRESEHSTPVNDEVKKNVNLYIYFPICLHVVVPYLVKHTENFTFFTFLLCLSSHPRGYRLNREEGLGAPVTRGAMPAGA